MRATAVRTTLLFAVLVSGASSNASAQRALTRFPLTSAIRLANDSLPRHVTTPASAPVVASIQVDSTPAHDSTATVTAPAATPFVLHRARSPKVFAALMAGGVLAVREFHLDQDPGGYKDGMRTYTDFPDKGVHALAAWALTNAGVDMKLSPWRSAATVTAAGIGYEFAQGYVSKFDIVADVAGATAAAAWRSWRASR